ncbi:MAG: ribonuclease H-like domain-containing protein [Lachnospiraceae bacterium]|nr:ribonuclease H-like domain-containing protein [Lachnospiraceae bacterium]
MKRIETVKEYSAPPFTDAFVRTLKALSVRMEDVRVFDIETTGLTPKSAIIYLIGIARLEGDTLITTQLLAESFDDEETVLRAFCEELKGCRLLLHFNGDRFDLPFVAARCARFGIETHVTISPDEKEADILSFDLYKKVTPVKKILGLPDCRLKSIERLLNIERKDEMGGGELIEVFEEYALRPTPEAEALLLLHNADDIAGTFSLLPVLTFYDFFSSLQEEAFCGASLQTKTYTAFDGLTKKECYLTLEVATPLPASFSSRKENLHLRYENNHFFLRIPVVTGTYKHFFPDYKNYYYLPYEDMAVHKSVGEFVDKNFRKNATKEEAFVKKEGDFLFAPCDFGLPVFKERLKDKLLYIENSEDLSSSESNLIAYGISILRYFAGFS